MAKISVIVPCYNVEDYIDRCIKSVLSQTIGREMIEVICVDDGSTDMTLYKLKLWEERYPEQIVIVACEKNGRQGKARNIGLNYATGEYVAFIDADDWVDSVYLEILYERATRYDLEVVSCGLVRDENKSEPDLNVFANEHINEKIIVVSTEEERKGLIMEQSFGGAVQKLIKHEFLSNNAIRFPEGLAYEDLYWREVFHLLLNRGMVIDAPLYHYCVNSASTSLKKDDMYHYDYFTIIVMLWDFWEREGYLKYYKEELEYEFLVVAALQIVKMLVYRFSTSQYNLFLLLQFLVRQRIPNVASNKYVNENFFSEIQLKVIGIIYMYITAADYEEFTRLIRKIGI